MGPIDSYLAKVIDAANEGIYVTDRERRFLLWNEAAERISGYRKEEMIGRSCYDNLLSHADREGRALCLGHCPLMAAIESGMPRGPEIVYLRHKTGKRIAVEVKTAPIRNDQGDIMGGVEVFQDVTERLERERLLREHTEKLETVLDGIGDGILFLDAEGTITVVNRACIALFDLGQEARGGAIHALPGGMPLSQALSAVEEAYRRSEAFSIGRTAARCSEGGKRFRCWTAVIERAPLAPPSKCFTCEAYRDIRSFLGKPRELEWEERTLSVVSSFIELPETNELWEIIAFHDVTAEKLDAALKVAGAAAHELRQPLQAIIMIADLLKKELRGRKDLEPKLGPLLECCVRMDSIIGKMSEITRYRTKDYIGDLKILDIEQSAD